MRLNYRQQGYVYVAITMLIWGSFTLLSRLNAAWHISGWDMTALRFSLASVILVPILMYQRQWQFLWQWRAVILALLGGVAYCLTVYSGFLYAPASHAAIFLNGCIPLFTAVAAWFIFRQPFDRHLWLSLLIILLSLAGMSFLILQHGDVYLGWGELLFVSSALCWGIFTVLLREWKLSAWHAMCSVAIWSTILYLPIYVLFLPKQLSLANPQHLILETIFHGVLVVIVATMSYVRAIERLGAFKTGSVVTLAPFIAAVLAVPLLHEPLRPAIVVGLIGMGIGALQPWRWFRADALQQQLQQQKRQQQQNQDDG